MTRSHVFARLNEAIGQAPEAFGEELFAELALELFGHQYASMPRYRALCDSRGAAPSRVTSWRSIPAVPTALFKTTRFFAGADDEIAHVFSTSGTSAGPGSRGKACFSALGLDLMARSEVVNAQRMLFPDADNPRRKPGADPGASRAQTPAQAGRRPRRKPGADPFHVILVLAPPPEAAPEMIMAWGMARLIEHFGAEGSGFLVGKEGLDVPGLLRQLDELSEGARPVTIIGGSFGFVNLLEGLRKKGVRFKLPAMSRTMDAGGYKGRSRELTRTELDSWIMEGFGIAEGMSVNLLGMTELASQFYDDTIAATLAGRKPVRRKQNPPWTRTRVVDPVTLEDVPLGEEGVLLHYDLANLDTPMAVLSDDRGRCFSDGFEILGRLVDDGSRGCSISIDELTGGAR